MAKKDEKEAPASEAAQSAPAAGGKNPLVTIVLIINAVLMALVAYFQFVTFSKMSKDPSIKDVVSAQMGEEAAAHAAAAESAKKPEGEGAEAAGKDVPSGKIKAEDGVLFPLEGFTANLAQGDGPRRYVRLQAVLKFSKDSSENEFKARQPQIRDSIISILNAKRPEDLLVAEGKQYLKEEIKAAINSFLIDGRVIDMYYVGFQIN